MVPPPTCNPAKQTRDGFGGWGRRGIAGRVSGGGKQAWNRVRREPLTGGMGMSCRVSAEVARARDSGDLVSLIVQGQRLQVGTTPYRTPSPSENLTTNAGLVHKRSNLSTQLEGSPALRTPEWRSLQVWGCGRVGRAPFTAEMVGLEAPQHCGRSRVTALDAGSARSAARLFPRTGDHRVGREDE